MTKSFPTNTAITDLATENSNSKLDVFIDKYGKAIILAVIGCTAVAVTWLFMVEYNASQQQTEGSKIFTAHTLKQLNVVEQEATSKATKDVALLLKGKYWQQQKQVSKATAIWDKLLQDDASKPLTAYAIFAKAAILNKNKQWQEAQQLLAKVTSKNEVFYSLALYWLADIALQQNKPKLAAEKLQKLSKLKSSDYNYLTSYATDSIKVIATALPTIITASTETSTDIKIEAKGKNKGENKEKAKVNSKQP